ncbi:MAG: PAS domain S-box protein, partial [Ginsengibacter sp.]
MKYHCLFEQATDAIMVTDFSGNFKDVNSSFCTLFGYEKEDLLHQNITALLNPEHLKIKPIRFDILEAGGTVFNEREMIHRNGTVIYVEANAKKFNEDSILVIARDVTARKVLEKELLDQKVQEQKKITKAVIDAQEKERAEIGAELHDNVNQLLATAGLCLHHSMAQPGDNSEFIIKSQEYLLAAMEEVRKLSHSLVGPTQDATM